jgi:GntR family transcriptional regulator/MocR family aminotransferase
MAEQLGVSRNTITLAYDALLAEGHLFSRPRSGIFVASTVQSERVTAGRQRLRRSHEATQCAQPIIESSDFRVPPNWLQYPYPFIDGCIEPSLAPIEGWRESMRLAGAKQDVLRWATSAADSDDPNFIDELRTKVLLAWGIDAAPDEVIGTISVQQALCLAIESLMERNANVVCDVDTDTDALRRIVDRRANLSMLEWDGDTANLMSALPRDAIVVVGGRRTSRGSIINRDRVNALLRAAESVNATIVEWLPTLYFREPGPTAFALRALARSERVITVAELSAVAALGTTPGIICCDARRMVRIRALRRRSGAEFPFGLQRVWAYFIGLGHYASARAKASATLLQRRTALRDALNHYLHRFVQIRAQPSTSSYWISCGPHLQPDQLARSAAAVGVLIEPVATASDTAQFCMGVTSIPSDRIREGVRKLAQLIRSDPMLGTQRLHEETAPILKGAALRRALAGSTLLYNTVYGEPCTMKLHANGVIEGKVGYSNEDQDNGRWWVDGDRWFRQWNHWEYGESLGLFTIVDNDQVRWFNSDGLPVDTAVMVRRRRSKS